jgi:outer membrane protein TolC
MSNFLRCVLASIFCLSASPAAELPRGLGFAGAEVEKLTIDQAIELALKNNLELQVSRVEMKVEQARTRFAAGVFDPVFRLDVGRDSVQRPDITSNLTNAESLLQQAQIRAIEDNTRAIQIATGQPVTPPLELPEGRVIIFDQDQDRFEASLGLRTPLGTQLAFIARQSKIRSTFDGDTRTITPFYQAFGGFEVRQPLLKDFGPAANLSDVRISRINERAAQLTWEKTLSDSVASVLANYFDMLFAQADLRVRQDAIAADTKLVQQNQRRLELGFMSPIDVQQARAQVSLDEELLIFAKNLFMERQFALRRLITAEGRESASRIYLPVHTPNLRSPALERSELLALAFRQRPDYIAATTEAERQDIRLRFAKNQLWPNLDVIGSMGYNGLGDSWDDARGLATHSQAPQWSVGIQFSMPLGRVQPRAQYDAIRGLKEQAILRIKQSELTVTVDVDTAMSRIETNRQRLDTARKTRELNEEAVRIAYRRLEEGQISSFDLIEQQRKLYDARSRELAAQADLNKAIVTLWQATGTILEQAGITIIRGKKRTHLPEAALTRSHPIGAAPKAPVAIPAATPIPEKPRTTRASSASPRHLPGRKP